MIPAALSARASTRREGTWEYSNGPGGQTARLREADTVSGKWSFAGRTSGRRVAFLKKYETSEECRSHQLLLPKSAKYTGIMQQRNPRS